MDTQPKVSEEEARKAIDEVNEKVKVAEATVESIELEDAVRLAFQKHFPLGHSKKKVALLKEVMQALVVYIIADKRKLLEGMKRQLELKNKEEQDNADVQQH